jgi:hypothetical protein
MKKMTATPVRLKAFTYRTKKLTRIRKATIKSSVSTPYFLDSFSKVVE